MILYCYKSYRNVDKGYQLNTVDTTMQNKYQIVNISSTDKQILV